MSWDKFGIGDWGQVRPRPGPDAGAMGPRPKEAKPPAVASALTLARSRYAGLFRPTVPLKEVVLGRDLVFRIPQHPPLRRDLLKPAGSLVGQPVIQALGLCMRPRATYLVNEAAKCADMMRSYSRRSPLRMLWFLRSSHPDIPKPDVGDVELRVSAPGPGRPDSALVICDILPDEPDTIALHFHTGSGRIKACSVYSDRPEALVRQAYRQSMIHRTAYVPMMASLATQRKPREGVETLHYREAFGKDMLETAKWFVEPEGAKPGPLELRLPRRFGGGRLLRDPAGPTTDRLVVSDLPGTDRGDRVIVDIKDRVVQSVFGTLKAFDRAVALGVFTTKFAVEFDPAGQRGTPDN
jgi:hypothetical protein